MVFPSIVRWPVVDMVVPTQNLPDAVELLTQATLRNIIARMTLDDTFSSREQINSALLSKVCRARPSNRPHSVRA